MATIINLEYFMYYSEVKLEESDWREPLILWIMMYMGSGSRKTAIHTFIEDVLYEKTMKIIRETRKSNKEDTEFLLHETTFEKVGSLLEENNGKKLFVFDEARHFWSQIELYSKTSNSRDEAVLLSLYNGAKWQHSTASGTSFNN